MVIKISRVHSPVVKAVDCRSAGPWFNSGWRTWFIFVTWHDKLTDYDLQMFNMTSPITTSNRTTTRKLVYMVAELDNGTVLDGSVILVSVWRATLWSHAIVLKTMPWYSIPLSGVPIFVGGTGVVHTSLVLESRVSPSTHSCSAAQSMAEQVMVLDSDSVGSEELHNAECSSRHHRSNNGTVSHLSSSGITGQEARWAIVRMFPDQQWSVKVSKAVRGLARHDRRSEQHGSAVERPCGPTKPIGNADNGEPAIRHVNKVGVSSCFLMEIDEGCLQPSIFDDSFFWRVHWQSCEK